MEELLLPAFGEEDFLETRTNENTHVIIISNVDEMVFPKYYAYFEKNELTNKEYRDIQNNKYASFTNGSETVFMNYFGNLGELSIVTEKNSNYFDFSDNMREERVQPQITQVHLEDFGLSEVVRLSDGRFIIFDGGWNFEPDINRLMAVLKDSSVHKKPIIAAWILTHPHCDHYHAFIGFVGKYANDVIIEKVMLNFPKNDDTEHFPELGVKFRARYDKYKPADCEMNVIAKLWNILDSLGTEVYIPHTGQRYVIGDAVCDVLSCMDDTVFFSNEINTTSLVIRMQLAGQVILWTADASFSHARLAERYGKYLKSNILQVPHHGFQCGTPEGEIAGYEYIRPNVCLLEASDAVTYTIYGTFRKGTEYLMRKADVSEIITGDETRTVTLPYTPPKYSKYEIDKKYKEGRENNGARTWIFSDLNTAIEEDFVFSMVNMTACVATVKIELFFECEWQSIKHITLKFNGYKRVNIKNSEDVDTDAVYFNWETLKSNGLPKNSDFAVRFVSDIPIVVSHKNHKEVYKTVLS